MAIPSKITQQHVLAALARIDRNGVPAGRGSRKFLLRANGKDYPPKYVVALAAEVAGLGLLDPESYGGGAETNNFLVGLGFQVVGPVGQPAAAATAPPPALKPVASSGQKQAPPTLAGPPPKVAPAHDERCSECKNRIGEMLQRLYGEVGVVKREHKIAIPLPLAAHHGKPWFPALDRVHNALQNHRGHKAFVRKATLHPCDIWVTKPGFLVELDESQHFTLARAAALQAYPGDLVLGFDRAEWKATCEALRRSDNDPPHRDEQRAWYDTLRDFAQAQGHAVDPTVRIRLGATAWCALDIDRPEDVRRFREMVPGLPGLKNPEIDGLVDRALGLLRQFEYQLQVIKVRYFQWVTHPEFKPPQEPIVGMAAGDAYEVIFGDNGNAFTMSPCGWGSAYQGGGNGSTCLPGGVYPQDAGLIRSTAETKSALAAITGQLRQILLRLLDHRAMEDLWALLQDLYWVKMGIHEFESDLKFRRPLEQESGPVRDLLVVSLRQGEDLRRTWKSQKIKKADLTQFIRGLRWQRYACCAFDAGPITISRAGFVRYSEVARTLAAAPAPIPDPGRDREMEWRAGAREWAHGILRQHYALLLSYCEPPLVVPGDPDGHKWGAWSTRRPEIATRIRQVEAALQPRAT
jgi:hypothetical protein